MFHSTTRANTTTLGKVSASLFVTPAHVIQAHTSHPIAQHLLYECLGHTFEAPSLVLCSALIITHPG